MEINYKNDLSKTKLREIYNNMNQRCYYKKYHDRSPQYIGCQICPEWLENKNKFYEWVQENYYTITNKQLDLDKDILIKGNKMYSPDTCIFAPHEINTIFENITRMPIYQKKSKTYKMNIWIDDHDITLGYYGTAEEAKLEYIKHKEAQILSKADLYKNVIPDKLYKAMINWKIELSDWDN